MLKTNLIVSLIKTLTNNLECNNFICVLDLIYVALGFSPDKGENPLISTGGVLLENRATSNFRFQKRKKNNLYL